MQNTVESYWKNVLILTFYQLLGQFHEFLNALALRKFKYSSASTVVMILLQ
jgi:hypothetical protein